MTGEDLVDAWLAALRSGEYKQGQMRLHKSDETYCCLGVLLEVAGFEWIVSNNPDVYGIYGGDGELYRAAPEHAWWDHHMPSWVPPMHECYYWNDSCGMAFDQIADKIDEHRPKG